MIQTQTNVCTFSLRWRTEVKTDMEWKYCVRKREGLAEFRGGSEVQGGKVSARKCHNGAWRDGSAFERTGCFARGPGLIPSAHIAAHNCL